MKNQKEIPIVRVVEKMIFAAVLRERGALAETNKTFSHAHAQVFFAKKIFCLGLASTFRIKYKQHKISNQKSS